MSVSKFPVLTVAICLVLALLTSCSGSSTASAKAETSGFYWSAARETYSSGDYMKTLDHLERLIDTDSEYAARALPWYLVLSSGVASGYMELADQYTAGAHANKAHAVAFRVKAMEYRANASRLALRFAQQVDKVGRMPGGPIPLAFALPGGNAEPPSEFAAIAEGTELAPADAETAQVLAIRHGVLMTACLAAGSKNDVAKAAEILGQQNATAQRATFAAAIAHMLDSESKLYSRNQLDDPAKLAIFHERAQSVLVEGAKPGSASVVQVGSLTREAQ
jgi:hypothetical protein